MRGSFCNQVSHHEQKESVPTHVQKGPKSDMEEVYSLNKYEYSNDQIITIDYAAYPQHFMMRLISDRKYLLKNDDTSSVFFANTKNPINDRYIMHFGNFDVDISSDVYYRKTIPVLIRYNNKNYIWICEESADGKLIAASFYYITQYDSVGSDTGSVNFTISDEILNPADFVMLNNVNCFGPALAKAHYKINEVGKPEEISNDEKNYYIEAPFSEELLTLKNDIRTGIYANSSSKIAFVKKLPAGTKFCRFRVPKNSKYNFAEGILEDGRVFRVIEEYWFSEPEAYHAMLDKTGKRFEYM